jgi:uncharacterized protein (TIGR02271 family)
MAPAQHKDDQVQSEVVVPVFEERAHVEKHEVSKGRIRVRTVAETVQEMAGATLESDELEVTRVAVDRVVTEPPVIRSEGDLTIIPVLEEVLFVEKRLVLKEEVHVRRRTRTETVEIPVEVRKQRAFVERDEI